MSATCSMCRHWVPTVAVETDVGTTTILVCPRCDRISCRRCGKSDLSGRKLSCCGLPLGRAA